LNGKIVAMSEPNDLRAALISLIQYAHGTHRLLDELSERVSSLENTVRGLDLSFDDVLAVKAAQLKTALEPVYALREEQFAELLERFRNLRLP
jgi:hypothetical protein